MPKSQVQVKPAEKAPNMVPDVPDVTKKRGKTGQKMVRDLGWAIFRYDENLRLKVANKGSGKLELEKSFDRGVSQELVHGFVEEAAGKNDEYKLEVGVSANGNYTFMWKKIPKEKSERQSQR